MAYLPAVHDLRLAELEIQDRDWVLLLGWDTLLITTERERWLIYAGRKAHRSDVWSTQCSKMIQRNGHPQMMR